jgi:hypothetical protein
MPVESSRKEAPIVLTVKISECLIEPLKKSKLLKQLRNIDIEIINMKVAVLAKNLEKEQASAFEKYNGIPDKAKTDKSILLPPDPNKFSGRSLGYFSKNGGMQKLKLDAWGMEVSIQNAQDKVTYDYTSLVMEKIGELHDINWERN